MRRLALLSVLLLTACPQYVPESLEFASDPRILRGRYEGAIDTRSSTPVLDLSADGSLLAMGAGDGRSWVQLWDTRTQAPFKGLGHLGAAYTWVEAVALTADGTQAVGTREGRTQVWDVATERVLHSLPTGGPFKISGDGALLATGYGNASSIEVYRVATGEKLHVWSGFGNSLENLAFSEDGKVVAALFSAFATEEGVPFWIRVWSAETGAEVLALEGSRPVTDGDYYVRPLMALSADGDTLAYATADTIRVLNVATGEAVAALPLPIDTVNLVLNPDGSELAATSYRADGRQSTRLVEVVSGSQRLLEGVYARTWSRDGRSLLGTMVAPQDKLYGYFEDRVFVPTLLDAESLEVIGTFVNGERHEVVLEAEAEYRAADHYFVSGTLQIGDEAAVPFEGEVRGNESQRYLTPQARMPNPPELTLTLRGLPWTLRGIQRWWREVESDLTETDWMGYVEGTSEETPPFPSFYLKRVEETP